MFISEIFHSIQGEGRLAGVPSAFVRTSGCNLRCWFCDTDYTSWHPEGEEVSVGEIMKRLSRYPTRHAVVTGGEPMLQADIAELCAALGAGGYHITIETAATVFRPVACDLASLSPKLANSVPHERGGGRFAAMHESRRIRLDVIRDFMALSDYQLKFVVQNPVDLDEIQQIVAQLPELDRDKVLLMPQGVEREELRERGRWLAEACTARGFRYCPRLHIELFGHRRGT